eukprot:1159186-Pelagomonas_calceolata.AAC.6
MVGEHHARPSGCIWGRRRWAGDARAWVSSTQHGQDAFGPVGSVRGAQQHEHARHTWGRASENMQHHQDAWRLILA